MIFNSLIVLSLLELVLGSPFWNSGVYQNQGPLPGRTAFTPEYDDLATVAQRSAFEIEHQRLKNQLAADHPDLIPHLSDGSYNPQSFERGFHTYDNGEYKPELYEAEFNRFSDDDGQYDPKLYEEQHTQYGDGQYKPHLYNKGNDYSTNFDDGKYRPNLYQQSQYSYPAFRPSPLNADGTVAHTPEYKAIAASLIAAHKKALSRHRRSTEHYQGPPAPLNHDFTVDYTPEVKHFNAAHFTAVASQFKRLHETAALAAAHPDLTSPPSNDYNPQSNHYVPQKGLVGQYHPQLTAQGQYSPEPYRPHHSKHYDDGQYRPHLYEQGQHYTQHGASNHPVQLNSDGTVAHTPEYNAIAGSFHAAFDQALHRHRRSEERYEGPLAPLNPDFTVDFTPEIKKVSDAHFSAVATQFKRLQEAAEFAAANPDRTSPPSPDYKPNYQA